MYLGRDHKQSQQVSVEMSQPVHLQMIQHMNLESDPMDIQPHSRRNTEWKASYCTQQFETISAPTTWQMSSECTTARTRMTISTTAGAPE